MKLLETQAFPVHPDTFEGTASSLTLTNKPYKIVHANENTDLAIEYDDGSSLDITLAEGEDIVLVGSVASITSTGSIKAS